MVSEADAEAALVESVTADENPSDTLMVRMIGELDENSIKKLGRSASRATTHRSLLAVVILVPRVKIHLALSHEATCLAAEGTFFVGTSTLSFISIHFIRVRHWTLRKAFQAHVPLVKAVRMMLDRSTRKSKGFCFVNFHSVSDAMSAKNRMIAAGILAVRELVGV